MTTFDIVIKDRPDILFEEKENQIGIGSSPFLKKFKNCKWWNIKYKFLNLSLYYDPDQVLGSFDGPYFEIYLNGETYRFATIDYLQNFILESCQDHDEELKTNPENFL